MYVVFKPCTRKIVRMALKKEVHPSLFGRAKPVTPWGKPALGMKTRNKKKYSNMYIIRRRK